MPKAKKIVNYDESLDKLDGKYKVGQRLREARMKKGWSQDNLAAAIDTNRSAISEYENGTTEMSSSTLQKMAHCLNVSADYLLFGKVAESAPPVSDVHTAAMNILANMTPEQVAAFLPALSMVQMQNTTKTA